MSRSEIYIKYRKEGRCTNCGGLLTGNRVGKSLCDKCKSKKDDYLKRNIRFFEEQNLCNVCGKVPVGKDEKRCPECRVKKWIAHSNYRREHPEYVRHINEWNRDRRQYRIENHLCTDCGTKLDDLPFKTCDKCRMRRRLNQRRCVEKKRCNK